MSWFLAARPKTLTAAVAPTLVGAALARCQRGSWSEVEMWYAMACFPAALLIQVGTNLVNDAEDFRRGADTAKRVGPTRVTQAGLLTMAQVHGAGVFCFLAGVALCLPAFIARGWGLVILVCMSCCAGYAYTGGPYPLAYHGLGDVTVLVFFGAVATAGLKVTVGGGLEAASSGVSGGGRDADVSEQLAYRFYDADTLVAGTQVGLLCCLLLAVNNIRDFHSDSRHNKRTLIVQYGLGFGKLESVSLVASAYALGLGYWYFWHGKLLVSLAPMLVSLPIAIGVLRDIIAGANDLAASPPNDDDAAALMKQRFGSILGRSALLHLVFSAVLAFSLAIDSVM